MANQLQFRAYPRLSLALIDSSKHNHRYGVSNTNISVSCVAFYMYCCSTGSVSSSVAFYRLNKINIKRNF